MSELRRRLFGSDSPRDASRTPSPAPIPPAAGTKDVSIPVEKLHKLNEHVKSAKQKSSKRRNAWIFGLGSVVGIFIALFFAQTNDVVDLAVLKQMNLDSLLDVLPAGLLKDAQEFQVGRIISALSHR